MQLKSAKDIQLTESEEEEEEEEEEEQRVPRSTANRQKDLELFWGTAEEKGLKEKVGGGGREASEGKPKGKSKSGGLLLDWGLPEQTQPAKKSPDVSEERRERKKKKSRKGSSSSGRRKGEREGEVGATNGVTTPSGGDPISVLDAWLNAGVRVLYIVHL